MDIFRSAVHKLGWVYRRLDQDYGIDAEVEIRDSNHLMTGTLARFQIKGSESESTPLRVKVKSFRYWTVSPIPIFIARVTPKKRKFKILDVKEYAKIIDFDNTYRTSKRVTMPIDFSNAISTIEWHEYVKFIAGQNHRSSLDMPKYTLHNPLLQEVSMQRLFRQHGGDINRMLRWYREETPDDQLAYEFSHVVFLKEQIESDPSFLSRLHDYVYSWDQ